MLLSCKSERPFNHDKRNNDWCSTASETLLWSFEWGKVSGYQEAVHAFEHLQLCEYGCLPWRWSNYGHADEVFSGFETMGWDVHSVREVKLGIVLFDFTFSGKTPDGEAVHRSGREYVIVYNGKIQHVEVRNKDWGAGFKYIQCGSLRRYSTYNILSVRSWHKANIGEKLLST